MSLELLPEPPPASATLAPEQLISRELTWLAFNRRVIAEAAKPGQPLLERVKFAAIFASNLDEFFMVRGVGIHLHRAVEHFADKLDVLRFLFHKSICWNEVLVAARPN